ncbi:MAG: bifunctional acetate--CoA ligase family protein/GNAT family N-acetyltransferase [Thermodesulfovibrionales bacterium]|nr:bifunctional acetate--CoA ligase family protein/GNAT family N-acetyltransferase [Thermodesulfovibrionales bacterium]
MSVKYLDFFFNPKRIAVIGACEDKFSIGYNIFKNLLGKGYKGSVYPVNPRREAIQGVEAYPKITDIQRDIDLAVLAVPPSEIEEALEQCGEKGVKGVIIPCFDFKTHVQNLPAIEMKMKQASEKYGIRILGPDSLGFIKPSRNLNVSLFPRIPPKGNIALISQSTTLSIALLDWAASKNIGFSYFISVGSKIDIKFADLIDFLGVDPETRAIILYIESIKNGRRFMTSVRSFASSKPIMVIKSGKFDLSAHVALTHSGYMAGEDKVYDAAFERAGVIRVDEILDLFYLAESLAKQRRPKGKRLAIITNSGGPAIIAVDALLRLDGELADFSDTTIELLQSHLTYLKHIHNPIDLMFEASSEDYELAIKSCLKDKEVDGVLVIHTPSYATNSRDIAQAVVTAAAAYSYKPVFTAWMGEEQVITARELLNTHGIPTFVSPEQSVRSFMYMYRYDYNLRLLHETPEVILKDFEPDEYRAEEVIRKISEEKRLILNFHEVKELFEYYGIPVIPTQKAQTEQEAVLSAQSIGYPVVLKIDSQKVIHKLEHGGVILNIKDEQSVREAFRKLDGLATSLNDPTAKVLIQPMVIRQGYELVIGGKKDPTFGSVILFGLGGELLEAVEDYSIGLPPLNQSLTRRMMIETKIGKYLKTKNEFENTLRFLEEILVRFSHLIIHFPHIKEIDINPFFVTEKECFVLDASILLEADVLEGFVPVRGDFCPPHLSICPYPDQYIDLFKLKDGPTVIIRPIRPEDEPLLAELLRTSSEQTLMMRFFRKVTEITHEQLVRYCHTDYDREMSFVGVIRDGDRETLIGEVRISKLPDMESAEMAVIVGDQWQGQGIGKALCVHCLKIAKELGITKMWMEILQMNARMMYRAEKMGFRRISSDDDSVRVLLEL